MTIDFAKLADFLTESGYLTTTGNPYLFSATELKRSSFYEAAYEVYLNLNGQQADLPRHSFRPGLVINERVFLEIDDHTHFNRYRTTTLRSPIYNKIRGVDDEKYRRYCRMYEKECLKSGLQEGSWSSKESVYHFGLPAAPGDFFGNGSPGWKWKAFCDYMIDLFAATNHFQIIRIPCYDNLLINNNLVRIGKLYETGGDWMPLVRYLEKKLSENQLME